MTFPNSVQLQREGNQRRPGMWMYLSTEKVLMGIINQTSNMQDLWVMLIKEDLNRDRVLRDSKLQLLKPTFSSSLLKIWKRFETILEIIMKKEKLTYILTNEKRHWCKRLLIYITWWSCKEKTLLRGNNLQRTLERTLQIMMQS